MGMSTENVKRLRRIESIDRQIAEACKTADPFPPERLLLSMGEARRRLVRQVRDDQIRQTQSARAAG